MTTPMKKTLSGNRMWRARYGDIGGSATRCEKCNRVGNHAKWCSTLTSVAAPATPEATKLREMLIARRGGK